VTRPIAGAHDAAAPPLVGPTEPPALHVMTFNIRRPLDRLTWRRADRWTHRRPRVRALVAAERPTVLCLQEAVPRQMDDVLAALGPAHRFVGYGRGRRRTGEGCPVVYDARRLELLEWRQHALSDQPSRAGSRSWGNVIPRIVVSARFRDRSTGAGLGVLNTHLDPFSRRSRVRSVAYLRSLVGDVPTIVTGDLNAGDASRAVRALVEDDLLADTWMAARHRLSAPVGTFGGYRMPRPNASRIDRILVSEGMAVDGVAINARRIGGGWPSDHLPVQAVVRVEGEETG
jgi:endonuclease/exonuclease/phosphatase family metal-dependent hydrolase